MSRVLFYMWSSSRQYFIEQHLFYLDQSKKRLLSQFEHIEQDADLYREEWLNKRNLSFDPDRDEPSSLEEQAHDESVGFYLMLDEMRMNTRLSVTAGMFYMWEKELRDWLTKEILHWHQGTKVKDAVLHSEFDKVLELLDGLGWEITKQPFYSKLDGLRTVVNAYKHGNGKAFNNIKQTFPQYLDEQVYGLIDYADFKNLHITEQHINEFSEAIVGFWEFIPERTFPNDSMALPEWFKKALKTDHPSTQP